MFKVDTLLAFYLIRLSDSVVGGAEAATSGAVVIDFGERRNGRINA
jgi:hypothetical protein